MNNEKKFNLEQIGFINTDYDYIYTDIENYLYRSSDDRVLSSYVEDIEGGDNFADYCKEFFDMLDEEEHYDDVL